MFRGAQDVHSESELYVACTRASDMHVSSGRADRDSACALACMSILQRILSESQNCTGLVTDMQSTYRQWPMLFLDGQKI